MLHPRKSKGLDIAVSSKFMNFEIMKKKNSEIMKKECNNCPHL